MPSGVILGGIMVRGFAVRAGEMGNIAVWLNAGNAFRAPPGNGKRVGMMHDLATTAPPGNGPWQEEQRPPSRAKTAPPGNGPRQEEQPGAKTAPPGNGPRQQGQRPPPRAKTAPPGNGPRQQEQPGATTAQKNNPILLSGAPQRKAVAYPHTFYINR